jgi:hypothetical protein
VLQHVCELVDIPQELGVGQLPYLLGLAPFVCGLALPDYRDLVGLGWDVPVERQVRQVEAAALEPFIDVRILAARDHLFPGLEPRKLLRERLPSRHGVDDGLGLKRLVRLDVGAFTRPARELDRFVERK